MVLFPKGKKRTGPSHLQMCRIFMHFISMSANGIVHVNLLLTRSTLNSIISSFSCPPFSLHFMHICWKYQEMQQQSGSAWLHQSFAKRAFLWSYKTIGGQGRDDAHTAKVTLVFCFCEREFQGQVLCIQSRRHNSTNNLHTYFSDISCYHSSDNQW